MKRLLLLTGCLLFVHGIFAQTVTKKLAAAIAAFESDPQMKHGLVSLCVEEAETGKPVFAHHAQIGLAPASTQKIITSGAAFELLGPSYRYTTSLAYGGRIEKDTLNGFLFIIGHGDPTLGSWRYAGTTEQLIFDKWTKAIRDQKIKKIRGNIFGFNETKKWPTATVPDGWIWQDIGNYYGAGADNLNWRENQYDLLLQPGVTEGAPVTIAGTRPVLRNIRLDCEVTTGASNSGDNAYIYLPPFSEYGVVRGTVPPADTIFEISGSFPNPSAQLCEFLKEQLRTASVTIDPAWHDVMNDAALFQPAIFSTHQSPALDSIVFWFLRKSINLYGEALIKTIGYEKAGYGSTEKGVELVRQFWAGKGIDQSAINIMDGSGLSPQNRVTTDALVKVLQFARKRSWYPSFYNALPEFNGMKMKSGSIGGARAYVGYHKAKDGKQYAFAIIVNNYDGSSGDIVKKLYKVLDVLK